RLRGLELRVEHHVAGVVHAAHVHADLQREQARDAAADAFEGGLEALRVAGLLLGGVAEDVPHHDVFEHGHGGFRRWAENPPSAATGSGTRAPPRWRTDRPW